MRAWNQNMQAKIKAGNGIGAKGACALGEALKVNTTVTELFLESVQLSDKVKQGHSFNTNVKAGNRISDEGAYRLSEAMKVNTTLTTLSLLSCVQKQHLFASKASHHQQFTKQATGSVLKDKVR